MKQEIKLPVEAIKAIGAGINKVIAKNTTLPILGCIHLQGGRTGLASASATNLDDYVTVQLHSTPGVGEFDGLVPWESLAKMIKGCAGNDLVTLAREGEELKLSYQLGPTTVSQRLEHFPLSDFPKTPELVQGEPLVVGKEFKEALKEAFESSSDDQSRYILNHAYVDISEPNAHYVVGTNGRQLFCANSFLIPLKESLIFPKRKFVLWSGFMEDGDWRLTLGQVRTTGKSAAPAGYVRIQSDRWTLVTRQVEGTYPSWRQVIPHSSGEKTIVRFNPQALEFICRAAPQLPGSDTTDQGVLLDLLEGGSVILHGHGKDHSASVPVVGATMEGKPVQVSLNRQFLVRAMKMGLSELEVFDPFTPMVFRDGGKRLVIAPLRPNAPAPAPAPATPAPVQDQSSSPGPVAHPSEEPKGEMKTTNRINTVQSNTAEESDAPISSSAFLQVKEQIERLRETLRGVVSDLNETARLLAQAQKEKKTTEKEIESVRATLRSLQRVQI